MECVVKKPITNHSMQWSIAAVRSAPGNCGMISLCAFSPIGSVEGEYGTTK